MLRAERAFRAAFDAFRALRAEQKDKLARFFAATGAVYMSDNGVAMRRDIGVHDARDLEAIITGLAYAVSAATGSDINLLFNRGKARRGPVPGSTRNYPLRFFIDELWYTAVQCKGCLTASCKSGKGSGSMFKALKLLAPLLPKNFVRSGTDQTIANWVASLRDGRDARTQAIPPLFREKWKERNAEAWAAATKRSRKRQTRST
jgi:hypothetical protein